MHDCYKMHSYKRHNRSCVYTGQYTPWPLIIYYLFNYLYIYLVFVGVEVLNHLWRCHAAVNEADPPCLMVVYEYRLNYNLECLNILARKLLLFLLLLLLLFIYLMMQSTHFYQQLYQHQNFEVETHWKTGCMHHWAMFKADKFVWLIHGILEYKNMVNCR